MKKLITNLLIFILIIAAIVFPVSMVIDPYNVFHATNPRDNGIESNKGFIKTSYILKNHDKFDSLVFGSSRAGFYDIGYLNEVTGDRFYDMASSECLISEQTRELKTFIKAGFVPKQIIVLVDDISCFVNPALHENMLYRVPYPSDGLIDKAEFYLKYVDLINNFECLEVIREHEKKTEEELLSGVDSSYDASTGLSYLDRLYETGTERLDKESQFDPNEQQYQKGYWVDYYSFRGDEAIEEIRELKKVCDENDIKLIIATNPLYQLTYEKAVSEGYIDFIYALSSVTDFYNFSTISKVTNDYHYYYETSHFTPEVTRMMTDIIFNDSLSEGYSFSLDELKKEGFGVKVNSDNIHELMEILKAD